MTTLIAAGVLVAVAVIAAIALAVRSASGGPYSHHGYRRH